LSGLKMADKKDIHRGKTSILTVVNTAARSRQEIIGPVLLPVSLAFLFKLGRYYEIRPLSRRLIFLGRKYFYRASFELGGTEKGHLAAVVLKELYREGNTKNGKIDPDK
jgi:hypothetical protein